MVHYNDASTVIIPILKCTYDFFVCESTFVWVSMLQKRYECINNLTCTAIKRPGHCIQRGDTVD